jgi:hypothetical protein
MLLYFAFYVTRKKAYRIVYGLFFIVVIVACTRVVGLVYLLYVMIGYISVLFIQYMDILYTFILSL